MLWRGALPVHRCECSQITSEKFRNTHGTDTLACAPGNGLAIGCPYKNAWLVNRQLITGLQAVGAASGKIQATVVRAEGLHGPGGDIRTLGYQLQQLFTLFARSQLGSAPAGIAGSVSNGDRAATFHRNHKTGAWVGGQSLGTGFRGGVLTGWSIGQRIAQLSPGDQPEAVF